MNSLILFTILSAAAFLYYGLLILFSQKMKVEFNRLGQSRFRIMIGLLQIAGSVGLVVGLLVPALGFLAALGIATLMLLGVSIRIIKKNSLWETLPALFFMIFNTYLSILFFNSI